jgi:hypothetical protein
VENVMRRSTLEGDDEYDEDDDEDESEGAIGNEEDEDNVDENEDEVEGSEDDDQDEDEDDFEEDKVFVIMQFRGKESQEIFSAINDECSRLGLNAEIASEMAGSGLVVQDIYNATSQAEFIICDLTGERPNVYYELGQAHGLGNDALRILLIAKEGTPLHFDVAPFRARFYQSTEDLRTIIRSELSRMMELTRDE